MAELDRRQMNRMRQDAIRRSKEMHRKSAVSSSHYTGGGDARDVPADSEVMPGKESADLRKNDSLNEMLKGLLSEGIDADKLLIAAVLLLLLHEGGDRKLLIALGYILM